MTIDERFLETHAGSAALHAEAARLLPGGITHDIRHFEPFPIYVERAAGCRKWDVDGNEIIDFVMGHGALLYGHAHPLLVDAVTAQIQRGTHYGASHPGEVEWARLVVELVPSAEKVRFVGSGTEATMMAARLARSATGRTKLLKLREHFHGWNDSWGVELVTQPSGELVGLPRELAEVVTVVDQHDEAAIEAELATGEYAALICEPGGAHWGALPLEPAMLGAYRSMTESTGTLLIFDEVVTGFRASEHCYQGLTGVMPDLTTLAKIVAGGLPGGAVAGRAALLDQIAITPSAAPRPDGTRVLHPGTFNANPLTAAAGVAALRGLQDGAPVQAATAAGERLCRGWNEAIRSAEAPGAAYCQGSMVHLVLGEDVPPPGDGLGWNFAAAGRRLTTPRTRPAIEWPFRRALLSHGVDLMGMGALASAVHSDGDVDQAIEAFSGALGDLRRESIL
ncbi:MAG: glutamate-1-semialdehyde 2,1-aminomutase [Chloroflexi bacterium]|nr:MAG: glutamate-1-semialdehyde 2,1-aminomutase [Chloroflexota bacterium]